MPPINLSEGSIAVISSGDSQGTDIKPVLQVADIRLVGVQNQNNNERYRILLSDGTFTQQGMLATQRNDLVRSEKLQKGSIVRLTQFVCNLIQNRIIIIIIDLDVLLEKCDPIGEPRPYPLKTEGNASAVTKPPTQSQPMKQPQAPTSIGNSPSYGAASVMSSSASGPNVGGGIHVPHGGDQNSGPRSYGSSVASNMDAGRYNQPNNAPVYPKPPETGYGVSRAPSNNYVRPPQSSYQPPQNFSNRGPIAKNEAPPRIIPIAALNPYQGRWTIKARVTVKGELRHYNNPRGDGKVFSFDLLDSDGGEIRVTCFNAVADQFYPQIEPGKIYMISRGTLKPAQKAFNHLRNDHEIMLDNTSTIQPCYEDDVSIPQQQFHFRPISDIESLDNNSVMDVIGIVSSISPSSSIMRKNGTETLKRTLQLKDMSGRIVELTMWGNFCNVEGQTLQNLCDSGVFPVLAVKSSRVSDFNGKSVGTISTSQLFIEPEFPEALKLRTWFQQEGKSTPSISLSREMGMTRTDVRKTVTQIKDEKLGTSEKPDWITVAASVTFIKMDNFCYTACPVMIGDRQCNKKVTNNGDGKWRCERCDQTVDECDYRYILQLQIQDHTSLTWVTAFQESGADIMGISAKELYLMKYEEQDEEKFAELVRSVLFNKFLFKLKVKEEIYSDEQRVKSTVVKAEKINFLSETKFLLDLIAKSKGDNCGTLPLKTENTFSSSLPNFGGFGASPVPSMNYNNNSGPSSSQMMNTHSNQYGGSRPSTVPSGMYMTCSSCGGTGHNASNCPSLMNAPGQSSSYGSKNAPGQSYGSGPGTGGAAGECYKCHKVGHWARDCPNGNNAAPNAYGGRYGTRQHVG